MNQQEVRLKFTTFKNNASIHILLTMWERSHSFLYHFSVPHFSISFNSFLGYFIKFYEASFSGYFLNLQILKKYNLISLIGYGGNGGTILSYEKNIFSEGYSSMPYYNNNFMIPVALSGDRTYNPDTIRKYVISGNSTIPGASTVHFDEIAKDKIFASIDKIKGMKSIIRESYISLKNRLGRVPYLLDFYENGEVDPLVVIKEYKTYQAFLESVEKEVYIGQISEEELVTLEYLSKTVLSGARPYELEILKRFLKMLNVRKRL